MYWQKRQNKYKNKSCTYNGHIYHSIREATYAEELDIRVMAGELSHWERQVPIDLVVNGHKIATYRIDFVEHDKNGGEMWTEVKGFETPEWKLKWKLKWKLFEALYPERDKQVIR